MNARVDTLPRCEVAEAPARTTGFAQIESDRGSDDWNPDDFAREQIRALVRLVFFARGRAVHRVVFSAAEPNLSVASICDQVARSLALETLASVALVECNEQQAAAGEPRVLSGENNTIKFYSPQMAINLWRVSRTALGKCNGETGTGRHWISCLAQLRNEFEYLVIHGPAAAGSSEAALLGHLTDGIVLVLGAHSTRKASAKKIKEAMEAAQSRILGTVLSDRRFPIPERIYRRL